MGYSAGHFLRRLETEIENRNPGRDDRWHIHLYDCPAMFDALRTFTNNGKRTSALAPYGPKTMSLAMCLFAYSAERAGLPSVPVYYTQPRRYALRYSEGIKMVDGRPDIQAYCLRIDATLPSFGAPSRATRPTTNSPSSSTGRAVSASIRCAARSTPSSFTSTTQKKRRLSLVTSIEGFRATAARTGNYRPDENEPAFVSDNALKAETNPARPYQLLRPSGNTRTNNGSPSRASRASGDGLKTAMRSRGSVPWRQRADAVSRRDGEGLHLPSVAGLATRHASIAISAASGLPMPVMRWRRRGNRRSFFMRRSRHHAGNPRRPRPPTSRHGSKS